MSEGVAAPVLAEAGSLAGAVGAGGARRSAEGGGGALVEGAALRGSSTSSTGRAFLIRPRTTLALAVVGSAPESVAVAVEATFLALGME